MFVKTSEYSYDNPFGNICVVPRPTLEGVKVIDGKPSQVKYHSRIAFAEGPYRYFKDLKGLNIENYDRLKPALVVYQLGDGSLLAATPAVSAIATASTNNACSKGSACFVHQVSDLELMPELPISEYGCPGLPAFQFQPLRGQLTAIPQTIPIVMPLYFWWHHSLKAQLTAM